MKEETYETKEGEERTKYKLEPGDKVVANYDSPRTNKNGKYTNYSLGVKHNEQDIFIVLTKTQAKKLLDIGNIKDKEIEAYEYENEHGKQVGVKVNE